MSNKLRMFFKNIHNTTNNTSFKNDIEYLNLVSKVLKNGKTQRWNVNVLSSFGEKMEFSLNNYKVPVITTKKLAWKTCLKELLWFISGKTSNKILTQQNVNIWVQNADLDFKKI